ncbi:MAG TPA: hypothetical protein PLA59_11055, partial [Myxococcota bacterium]|nr:hypothetical protein [Myxococcota bacterium]
RFYLSRFGLRLPRGLGGLILQRELLGRPNFGVCEFFAPAFPRPEPIPRHVQQLEAGWTVLPEPQ